MNKLLDTNSRLPDFGLDSPFALPSYDQAPAEDGVGIIKGIGYGAVGTVFKGMSTIVDSVTRGERGLGDALARGVGSEFEDFYQRNEGTLDTLSGIAGSITAGIVAPQLFAAKVGTAMYWVKATSANARGFGWAHKLLSTTAASRVNSVLSSFKNPLTVVSETAAPIIQKMHVAAASGKLMSLKAAGAGSGMAHLAMQTMADVAIGEVAAYGLMNKSGIYDNFGSADYFKWLVGGTALATGIRGLVYSKHLRVGAQSAKRVHAQAWADKHAAEAAFAPNVAPAYKAGLYGAIADEAAETLDAVGGLAARATDAEGGAAKAAWRAATDGQKLDVEEIRKFQQQYERLATAEMRKLWGAPLDDFGVTARQGGTPLGDEDLRFIRELFRTDEAFMVAGARRIEDVASAAHTKGVMNKHVAALVEARDGARAALDAGLGSADALRAAERKLERYKQFTGYHASRDGSLRAGIRWDADTERFVAQAADDLPYYDRVKNLNHLATTQVKGSPFVSQVADMEALKHGRPRAATLALEIDNSGDTSKLRWSRVDKAPALKIDIDALVNADNGEEAYALLQKWLDSGARGSSGGRKLSWNVLKATQDIDKVDHRLLDAYHKRTWEWLDQQARMGQVPSNADKAEVLEQLQVLARKKGEGLMHDLRGLTEITDGEVAKLSRRWNVPQSTVEDVAVLRKGYAKDVEPLLAELTRVDAGYEHMAHRRWYGNMLEIDYQRTPMTIFVDEEAVTALQHDFKRVNVVSQAEQLMKEHELLTQKEGAYVSRIAEVLQETDPQTGNVGRTAAASVALDPGLWSSDALVGGWRAALHSQNYIGKHSDSIVAAKQLDATLTALRNKRTEELMKPVMEEMQKVVSAGQKDVAAAAIDAVRRFRLDSFEAVGKNQAGENLYRLRLDKGEMEKLQSAQYFGHPKAASGERFIQTKLQADIAPEALWEEFGYAYYPAAQQLGGVVDPVPVVVTESVKNFIEQVSKFQHAMLADVNALRRAEGLAPVRKMAIHVPSYRYSGKERIFVVDPATGDVKRMYAATTSDEARRIADTDLTELRKGDAAANRYQLLTEDEMALSYRDLYDEQWESLVRRFDDSGLQTGGQRGQKQAVRTRLGDEVFQEMFASMRESIRNVDTRTRMVFARPSLEAAKTHSVLTHGQEWNPAMQLWQNTILGRTVHKLPTGSERMARAAQGIDDTVEGIGGHILDAYDSFMKRVGSMGMPVVGSRKANVLDPVEGGRLARAGAAIQKAVDEANFPFKAAEGALNDPAFIERMGGIAFTENAPKDVKGFFSTLNKWTTYTAYSAFRASASLINLLSTLPMNTAMASEMARHAGESVQAWQTRVGMVGHALPEGFHVNPMKTAIQAMHDAFRPIRLEDGSTLVDTMKARGWLAQPAHEVMNLLNQSTFKHTALEKALDLASKPTNYTEQMARVIGANAGFRIGRAAGMDEKAAMHYASWFANFVAGDYTAVNKPRVFQGTAGMPVGLFTTFMWNVAERSLGWIENVDLRTYARTAAVQSMLFGAEAVPGYAQAEALFSTYDGKSSPLDCIRREFGETAADLWAYGTLSNLPRIFGAEDGVALHKRGDLNIKAMPNVFNPTKLPAFQVASDLFKLVTEGAGSIARGEGMQALGEIASSYMPNHFVRKMLEQAQGYAVDRRGQLVDEDVNRGMTMVANALSLDSLRQARTQEAWRRQRLIDARERSQVGTLRESLRRKFRAQGTLSQDDLMDGVSTYVRNGGTPDGFRQFIERVALDASMTKFDQEFLRALQGGNIEQAMRFIRMTGGRLE